MRRGFFRLWVVFSLLWGAFWVALGAGNGLVITPAHEIAAPADRAAFGLPASASELDLKLAILDAGSHDALPKGKQVPAAFDLSGTALVLGLAVSAPALLFAMGWAFAGFSRPVGRA